MFLRWLIPMSMGIACTVTAANGAVPKNVRLADGTVLTDGMRNAPTVLDITWQTTAGDGHSAVRLVDAASGNLVAKRDDLATPRFRYAELQYSHRYQVQLRNRSDADDPWLKLDFVTVSRPVAPTVVTAPSSRTECPGSGIQLSVAATGTAPLRYQWQKDGVDLPQATGASLSFVLSGSTAGRYRVIVRNAGGEVRSTEATVSLRDCTPPQIHVDLLDALSRVGSRLLLRVEATGAGPLRYHWSKDGRSRPEFTGPTLELGSASRGDSGTYQVLVVNEFGVALSRPAQVRIGEPPTVTRQPVNQSVDSGAPAAFTIEVATPDLPVSYQWVHNNVPMPAARSQTLLIPAATLSDAGFYHCEVANAFGSSRSTTATLVVNQPMPPVITQQPRAVNGTLGGAAEFRVEAVSQQTPSFQWYRAQQPLAGATNSVLRFANVARADEGDYRVVVRNAGGAVTSRVATLSVVVPLVAGQYNGLFYESTGVRHRASGQASLTLDGRGRFTGSLLQGTLRFPLAGQMDSEGTAQVTTVAGGSVFLRVSLKFDERGGMTGRVEGPAWDADLILDRSVFSVANPCPWKGTQTWVLPPNSEQPETPQGYSFATVVVQPAGRVTVNGKLADGTAFTTAATVSPDGAVPVYVSLYRGSGSLLGWLNLHATNLSGAMYWGKEPTGSGSYAAGFETQIESTGAIYRSSQPTFRANPFVFMLNDPAVEAPLVLPVVVRANGSLESLDSRLTIQWGTGGGLRGTVRRPFTGTRVNWEGMVIQPDGAGYGFILLNGLSYPVLLGPRPE